MIEHMDLYKLIIICSAVGLLSAAVIMTCLQRFLHFDFCMSCEKEMKRLSYERETREDNGN